ncbi:Wadjet anti-phage system protein JetD domain-containing protein [Micromonospora sp. CA-263727]|uniref:Wadjet anti-phage system protein JetD domain-containing protein n=1 Tax=Micromonospora sp. CA-263727 TaxID=3239967 RepID=UPI003D8E3ABA
MKSPEQVLTDIERRLANTWARCVADPHAVASLATAHGTALPPRPVPSQQPDQPSRAWPHAFPLGQPLSTNLEKDFSFPVAWAATWRAWSATHGTSLRTRSRRVHNTNQELPTHLVVTDVDHAAQLCGGHWPQRLERGRQRSALLTSGFPHLVQAQLLAATVAAVDELSEVDFELLCRAGAWFTEHDAAGLTPRQVPIEGLHAKWLNHRLGLVRRLSGKDDLGLLPPHPPRVHFTYLDPVHLAAGGRRHDSITIGDRAQPEYQPRVVVISENKDTAIQFPQLDGGISVEGVGRGGGAIAALPWLTTASHVLYWGDMDGDGLEILDQFRAVGVPATSLFMSLPAYEEWERYGTNVDARNRPLRARTPRPVPFLTAAEEALYRCLIAESWTRYRRVEQERIPLEVAVAAVRRIVDDTQLP